MSKHDKPGYERPKLTDLGSLSELTAGKESNVADQITGQPDEPGYGFS